MGNFISNSVADDPDTIKNVISTTTTVIAEGVEQGLGKQLNNIGSNLKDIKNYLAVLCLSAGLNTIFNIWKHFTSSPPPLPPPPAALMQEDALPFDAGRGGVSI